MATIYVDVKIKNTGSVKHTFYVGLSICKSIGGSGCDLYCPSWVADSLFQSKALNPGSWITVSWVVDVDEPGDYYAVSKVWSAVENGLGVDCLAGGSGQFNIPAPVPTEYTCSDADLNGDGKVNVLDLAILGAALNSHPGDSNWNPVADINKDGVVNVLDQAIMGKFMGMDCGVAPPPPPPPEDTYLITIVVRDYYTKEALQGALVSHSRTGALGTYTDTETTDAEGKAYFNVPISEPKGAVKVTKTGYNGRIMSVYSTTHYVNLKPKTGLPHTLTFHVREDNTLKPIKGAVVTLDGETKSTSGSGDAYFELVEGLYDYTVQKGGYETETNTAHMPDRNKTYTLELEGGNGDISPGPGPDGRIRITVLSALNNLPLSNIAVYIEQSASGYGKNFKTNSKGEVVSDPLWSGEYVKFQANLGEYQGYYGSGWVQATILPDMTSQRTVKLQKK